jgi:hypothetical protein
MDRLDDRVPQTENQDALASGNHDGDCRASSCCADSLVRLLFIIRSPVEPDAVDDCQ